jgi:phage regulator Rha-like protein
MTDNFRIDVPFETKPPRLKDLVNNYVMGDVWGKGYFIGPVTDSLRIADKFQMEHKHVLRAVVKCIDELSIQPKFGLNRNITGDRYLGGAKGKERQNLKYVITEFGLALWIATTSSQPKK